MKTQITFPEKRFFEWHEDPISVTLRNKSGSYGGGSEVIVISYIPIPSEPCARTTTKAQTDNTLSRES